MSMYMNMYVITYGGIMGKHSTEEPGPRLNTDGGRLFIEFYDHVEALDYAARLNAAVAGNGQRFAGFYVENVPDETA
jgi:hypothetical protein